MKLNKTTVEAFAISYFISFIIITNDSRLVISIRNSQSLSVDLWRKARENRMRAHLRAAGTFKARSRRCPSRLSRRTMGHLEHDPGSISADTLFFFYRFQIPMSSRQGYPANPIAGDGSAATKLPPTSGERTARRSLTSTLLVEVSVHGT